MHRLLTLRPSVDHRVQDIGYGKGKNYSVNFPLRDGVTDESYKNIFEPVISQVMEWYRPSAVVLQCGADSLSGDRLGCFNLSMQGAFAGFVYRRPNVNYGTGHANCVQFIKSFNLPLLLLGGGGYTIRNVSRAWAYETGLAAGVELGTRASSHSLYVWPGLDLCTEIPMNEYFEYFGPTYALDIPASNIEDLNTREYLEKIKIQVFENLRQTGFAPSVQQSGASSRFELVRWRNELKAHSHTEDGG